ncbi:hypothetical protein L7F22_018321, partial [Adiantum nelumboides]|nr:hypothetical protein [Adiantum nelumboides]
MRFGAASRAGSRGGSPREVWDITSNPAGVEKQQPPGGLGQHPKRGLGMAAPGRGIGAVPRAFFEK